MRTHSFLCGLIYLYAYMHSCAMTCMWKREQPLEVSSLLPTHESWESNLGQSQRRVSYPLSHLISPAEPFRINGFHRNNGIFGYYFCRQSLLFFPPPLLEPSSYPHVVLTASHRSVSVFFLLHFFFFAFQT